MAGGKRTRLAKERNDIRAMIICPAEINVAIDLLGIVPDANVQLDDMIADKPHEVAEVRRGGTIPYEG